jgi:hypothetical protein
MSDHYRSRVDNPAGVPDAMRPLRMRSGGRSEDDLEDVFRFGRNRAEQKARAPERNTQRSCNVWHRLPAAAQFSSEIFRIIQQEH